MGDVGSLRAPEVDLGIAVLAIAAPTGVGLGFSWFGVIIGAAGLPTSSLGGVSGDFDWKPFIAAQAFTSVPSTEQ